MERMSPLDASFLYIEDGVTHMVIASCAVFEGPPPPYQDVVDMMRAKLPLIPRYRQVVHFVPLQLGRPVWVDDPHFMLAYHVRHTALPLPGSDVELRALMGRLMSGELDRHRPLWELWMVEGLEGDRWAMITRVHHCMVDGVAGTDLLSILLDRDPVGSPPVEDDWDPEPQPSPARLAAVAIWDLATSPYEKLRALGRATRPTSTLVHRAAILGRGLLSLTSGMRSTPPTSLSGTIGPHRCWHTANVSLADVKTIKAALGGTVNDVVLALIARGFRDLLTSRGEDVSLAGVRSLVPVSVRPPDRRGESNNLVSAMLATLPVGVEGAAARLAAVRKEMASLKASHEADAGETLSHLVGFAAPVLLAAATRTGVRVMERVPPHRVITVTTNVPGPQYPLYAAGKRMVGYYPYVPIAPGCRVGVAIVSYDDQLSFGVTGDFDTAPDIDILCRGIEADAAELLALARVSPPAGIPGATATATPAPSAGSSRDPSKRNRARSTPTRPSTSQPRNEVPLAG